MDLSRRTFLVASAGAAALQADPPKNSMAVATTCYLSVRRPKDMYDFLEYCHSLGAGGIQATINDHSPAYLRKVREKAESYGMFIEAFAGLPKTDNDESFDRTLASAKEVGARCIRSACLGGRRYETFATAEDWVNFVRNSRMAIKRAVPMAEKRQMPFALENHKDWTVDEFVGILREYSSEYFGVCLDTGNNIALLDDPMEVVTRLAPYAISTHIKDMAVAEYPDGFLLSEVPFGDGMLDIPHIVDVIRKARPSTRMTLEMITRDPLKVPCLTEKYWATFPQTRGVKLASTLRMVRSAKGKKPLPMLSTLGPKEQLQFEEDNVKLCLDWARTRLTF